MRKNLMKQKLRRGEVCVGAFSNLHHAAVVELMGLVGLDFIILEGEHSSLTPEMAEHLYRAAELREITAVTRIGENSQQVIQKFLDSGCPGVLIPLVNTGEEAQRVVDSVKYPPVGKRGLAGSRATEYGLVQGGMVEHVRTSNEETFIAVQVETPQAVDNFEEILSVDHVDCIFFGPGDLSSNLGIHGQTRHPEVLSIIEGLGRRTVEAGKVAGTIVRDLEDYKRWVDLGFQWVCSAVSQFLVEGARSYLEPLRNYKA